MAKTVVGVYQDFDAGQQAVRELEKHGFLAEEITLVPSDGAGRETAGGLRPADRRSSMDFDRTREATVGATFGGLVGLVISVVARRMRVAPVVAESWALTTLAGTALGALGGAAGSVIMAALTKPSAGAARRLHRDGALVSVDTADVRAAQAIEVLQRFHPVDSDTERARVLRRIRATDGIQIPIIEEELLVGKQAARQGGVRIHTHTAEAPFERTVTQRPEQAGVERRPADRPLEGGLEQFQERTIEVPATSEEVVVRKQPRVVEEISIRKDVTQQPRTVRDTVRRTEVDVERLRAEEARDLQGFETVEPSFRSHYRTTFTNKGYSYDQLQPAYRLGYRMGRQDAYRNDDWSLVEDEARQQWLNQHPQSDWDDVRNAVQEGWQAARGPSH